MNREFGIAQGAGARHEVLRHLVDILDREGRTRHVRVLEIGSYEGESALVWSHAIGETYASGEVVCVDPWKPYLSNDEVGSRIDALRMNQDLKTGIVHERFCKNIADSHRNVPISWYKGILARFVSEPFFRAPFDIVYIDGSHRYQDVLLDLLLVGHLCLVAGGGILCGDDLESDFSVNGLPPTLEQDLEFDYVPEYHPGVSLAVHQTFGKVWSKDAVWAMRYRGLDDYSEEL